MLLSSAGCNLKSGFKRAGTELFDPDVTFIGRPERVAEGDFTQIRIEADLELNRHVVGFNAEQELTSVPLDGGEAVVIGPAVRYGPVRQLEPELLPPLLAFTDPSDGVPVLRFSDLSGQISDARVDNLDSLRRRSVTEGPDGGAGLEIATDDGRLLYVNPWTGQVHALLCLGVDEIGSSSDADCDQRFLVHGAGSELTWSIAWLPGDGFDSRQLVVRNTRLRESAEARFGSGVVSFQVGPGLAAPHPGEREAVVEACSSPAAASCRGAVTELPAATVSDTQLIQAPDPSALEPSECPRDPEQSCELQFVVLTLPGSPDGATTLAAGTRPARSDACGTRYHQASDGVYLSYFSPCGTGQLYLERQYSANGSAVASAPCLLDPEATTSPLVSGSRVVYVRTSAQGEAELYTQVLTAEQAPTDTEEGPSCGVLGQSLGVLPELGSVMVRNGLLTALVDFDTATATGRFSAWQPALANSTSMELTEASWRFEGSEVQARGPERVAQVSAGPELLGGIALLANFESGAGELLHVDLTRSPIVAQSLARDVQRNGFRVGSEDIAALVNVESGFGELVSYDSERGEAYSVGSGVAASGYNLGVQFDGVIYLADPDPETGLLTLQVSLSNTRDVFPLSAGVAEWREVSVPSPGILFTVRDPLDQRGVWFAPAR